MISLASDIKKVYAISFGAVLLGAFLAYGLPEYYVLAIPAAFLVVVLFLLSIESVYYLIAFCTPISIQYLIGSSVINLPNEPLMLLMLVLFGIKLLQNIQDFRNVLQHPLVVLIIINLVWLLITSVTSTLPIISFKYLFARLWTIVFGLFWGAIIFKNPKNINKFFTAFGFGLCLVIIYTTINHYKVGFSQEKCMLVMQPFMADHTVYSAVCSIVLVFSLVLFFSKQTNNGFINKTIYFAFICLTSLGVALSYSRAAVLSLIFVLAFYFLLKFKVKFKTMLVFLLLILGLSLVFSDEIYQKVKFNKSVSGKSIAADIQSISNVRTDESNVERLNRWESGYRMFLEKPFLGYGPGTYMFEYSPFQRAHEMTSISTTHGDMGSMHSEYFGPLVESGVFGLLIILAIFLTFIFILMRVYYNPANKEIKILALAILLAMLTYFFHGLLNNFLEQDKVAVIFWAMMGMAVALDFKNQSLRLNRN
ncbi:O-antigen ligase family protein [Pedobacter alpinus]|uniref:O-antigen ligase family protein n=1 Tax=Pedobacter alpinus TaxID=1590643 RepID=A0ABW5TPZ6_9SPHI